MNFINIGLANKKLLLLVGIIILALLPLVYTIVSTVKSPKKAEQQPQFVDTTSASIPQNIDLSSGKITEFENYIAGPYVEQNEKVCNQQDLKAAFGNIIDPEVIKPKTFDALPSLYGETNWWYVTGGILTKIDQSQNGLIYTLTRNNTSVKFLVFPRKTNIGINPGPKNSKKLEAQDLIEGDKATFYLTAKCGGNNPPLLTVQMMYSDSYLERKGFSKQDIKQ